MVWDPVLMVYNAQVDHAQNLSAQFDPEDSQTLMTTVLHCCRFIGVNNVSWRRASNNLVCNMSARSFLVEKIECTETKHMLIHALPFCLPPCHSTAV